MNSKHLSDWTWAVTAPTFFFLPVFFPFQWVFIDRDDLWKCSQGQRKNWAEGTNGLPLQDNCVPSENADDYYCLAPFWAWLSFIAAHSVISLDSHLTQMQCRRVQEVREVRQFRLKKRVCGKHEAIWWEQNGMKYRPCNRMFTRALSFRYIF